MCRDCGFPIHPFHPKSAFPAFPASGWRQFGGNYGGSRGGNRIAFELGGKEGKDHGRAQLHHAQLGKDFAAFCKMTGFSCTFHDLRHTFATMMIAGAADVRTVAGYLGHASVSMTLNIYADVDPDAKRAAVSKVQDCFDMDLDLDDEPSPAAAPPATGISFTVGQLEAMLAQAKTQQAMTGVA